MYKNKPFKPHIIRQRTNAENTANDQRNTGNSVNKPARSTENIIAVLKTANRNNVQEIVKENSPTKFFDTDSESKEKQKLVSNNENKEFYNVVFAKKSTKKHKTWEDDGILEVNGKTAVLKDSSGNVIGQIWLKSITLEEGSRLSIGSKDLEIIGKACHQDNGIDKQISLEPPLKKVKTNSMNKPFLHGKLKKAQNLHYEPLIMPFVNSAKSWSTQAEVQKEVEVAVDPCLARVLRDHQRQGVVFLYQCIMGLSLENYHGAILADEMGLGKTLQCITLVWTLLNKGPYGKPVLRRIIIVTPSSLCNNWDKEFLRWLGCHRIAPYVVNSKNKLSDFRKKPRSNVLIISYEMFIRCHEEVNNIQFDLLICDEGHRLKNSDIKATKLLNQVNCNRRILLSGTPIQNDLQEFYTLVDFVNPGILGSYNEYKVYYESHISSTRSTDSSVDDHTSLGKERAQALHDKTRKFILRRTQETNNQYLPSKHEIVVFCQLSKTQSDLYSLITTSFFEKESLSDKNMPHLSIIMALKKICNHPSLLTAEKNNLFTTDVKLIEKITRIAKTHSALEEYSGKISIVRTLMRNLKSLNEKLVLVSYYTQTLDLLESTCCTEGLKFLRLDGSTPPNMRTRIIEQFNTVENEIKVFLLSAKAGGVGLNLSGASRLVLFDSDWNPASDAQAMARIWRDGQKKDVYIYRLLTTGTIEEKIYQRQVVKTSLSEAVVDSNYLSCLKLSSGELKDLFSLAMDSTSLTHDALKCDCNGLKRDQKFLEGAQCPDQREYQFTLKEKSPEQNLTINQLLDWQHYKFPIPEDVTKGIMLYEVAKNITFIFKNSTLRKSEI